MKFIQIYCLLFLSSFLAAQTQGLLDLERALTQKSRLDFVQSSLKLSEGYYMEGFYAKSAVRAKRAFETSQKLGNRKYMATSLTQEGKALLKIGKRKTANRKKAVENFRKSIRLTNDPQLKIENLEQLETLARQRGKTNEAELIALQIARLKGEPVAATSPLPGGRKGGLFGKKRKQAIEKAKEMQQENRELNEQMATLDRQRRKLESKSADLQGVLLKKDSAIVEMSNEQMRTELMILEKERMVDSFAYATLMDSMFLANQDSKIVEQETQIQLKNSQRNLFLALASIGLVLMIALLSRYLGIKRHNAVLEEKNKIIREEKKRSEDLLLNILPAAIADELKARGVAETRQYERATVLFTDFKNFSNIAKTTSPEQLIRDLDHCFKNFDRIIGKYELEKIKTIGDAYMCAGGLPKLDPLHPLKVVKAALEIQQFLMEWKLEKVERGEHYFEARVGIHTGPLIAGVVGMKKFAYDIWGDTVNVASRMESSGEAGKVNISAATYELVKDQFDCEYRGKIKAKNIGEVEMYFVKETAA